MSPSASAMLEVSTVSVSPTWAVPLMVVMVGAPVAGLLGASEIDTVASSPLMSMVTVPTVGINWVIGSPRVESDECECVHANEIGLRRVLDLLGVER